VPRVAKQARREGLRERECKKVIGCVIIKKRKETRCKKVAERKKWNPSKEQIGLADRLIDVDETKSVSDIIKELKIARSTYYLWRNDPNFANYLMIRSRQAFKDAEADVNRSFLNKAKNGSYSHQKLYYEMVDRYQAKVQLNIVNDEIKKMTNEELAALANLPDAD